MRSFWPPFGGVAMTTKLKLSGSNKVGATARFSKQPGRLRSRCVPVVPGL